MKRFLTLLAILFSIAGHAQSAEELFNQALKKNKENHQFIALNMLDKAIKLNPDSSKYYVARANIYLQMLKPEEALNNYKTAIEKAPKNPDPYFYRAILWYMIRRPQEALNDNNTAIKYATTDSIRNFALANRASDKVMLKDFAGALEDYQAFIKKDPKHKYSVYPDVASVLYQMGKTEEAVTYNMEAFAADSSNVKPLVNLSYQFGKKGDYTKAIFYADKAIKIDPKNPYAYSNRSFAELKQGNLNAAMNDINTSLKIDPGNAYAYKNRALIYIAQKLKTPACTDLKSAKQLGYSQVYDDEVDKLIAKNCLAAKPAGPKTVKPKKK